MPQAHWQLNLLLSLWNKGALSRSETPSGGSLELFGADFRHEQSSWNFKSLANPPTDLEFCGPFSFTDVQDFDRTLAAQDSLKQIECETIVEMVLDPRTVINELKTFSFFASFDESLLLPIASKIHEVEFQPGELFLKAQQNNDTLYFIREGVAEVLIQNEKVNELSTPGEVVGEMSVLSGIPVSADIRAQTKLKCFSLSTSDFQKVPESQKDRFEMLLYRIYSAVLKDRLIKTNEKAKLYEITSRELAAKTRELQMITAAQMQFLRTEASPYQKIVLLLDPNRKQQTTVKTAMASAGVKLLVASSQEEAKSIFSAERPHVIFCDESSVDFLEWAHSQKFEGQTVLLESQISDFKKLQSLPHLQNVISRDPEDKAGTTKSVLTALSKILHKDYFGLEKYLNWGTDLKRVKIDCSDLRDQVKVDMVVYFRSLGIRNSLLDRVQVAAEEMMMNAIYDAPVDENGKPLYNHLPRTRRVDLPLHYQPEFSYGCDGNLLAVSIQDPFGTLTRETVIDYLECCYSGRAGALNTNKGGAGRGLHQILESCDWTIFNVKPGERTEVIGLFDLNPKRDSPPQFHFFFEK